MHRLRVALDAIPDVIAQTLSAAEARAQRDALTLPGDPTEWARPVELAPCLGGRHEPIVYFVANGTRVKIGYTTRLFDRLRALTLQADAVLLLLEGGMHLESALHKRFGKHRIAGTEWFALAPEIVRYVGARLAQPQAVVRAMEASSMTSPSESRSAVEALLREFETEGRMYVQTRDFLRPGNKIERSRSWISRELARLARTGRLVASGNNLYRVVPSGRSDGSPAN
jgi:hypothetical protein